VPLLNSNSPSEFQRELNALFPNDYVNAWFDAEWISGAWELRNELVGELSLILEARTKEKIECYLKKFIDKANAMEFKVSWDLWPPGKNVGVFQPSPAYAKLGVGQGVLKIGKWNGIVPMLFPQPDSPKEYICLEIILALQSGQFKYLGRCQFDGCRRFFVASRKGNRYCPNNGRCRRADDRQKAGERTRKSRSQKAREKVKREKEQQTRERERLALTRFGEFLKAPDQRVDLIKKLGKGENMRGWKRVGELKSRISSGTPIEKIWETLHRVEKDLFLPPG
jgi:hypothetical protein